MLACMVVVVIGALRLLTPTDVLLLGHQAWSLFGLLALVAVMLWWMLLILLPWRPLARSDVTQIVASSDGVIQILNGRRMREMRWEQVRLLEVGIGNQFDLVWGQSRHYTLYSTAAAIEWHVVPDENRFVTPVDATKQELRERADALLDLAAARTGLAPRTFDVTLQPAPSPVTTVHATTPRIGLRRVLTVAIGLVALTVIVIACGGSMVALVKLASIWVVTKATTVPFCRI